MVLWPDEHMVYWFVQKLKVTYVGVELIELNSGDLRWCLDFRDMDTPAIFLLSDSYGKKNIDHGGFVLCPLYGRKSKAFQAASGTSNTAIISQLVTSFSFIGVFLHFALPLCFPWNIHHLEQCGSGRNCSSFNLRLNYSFQSKTAKSMVGLSLTVDSSQSLPVSEYVKRRGSSCEHICHTFPIFF